MIFSKPFFAILVCSVFLINEAKASHSTNKLPSEKCEVLKDAASARAYNKTNLQKLKSKLGSIVRTNHKKIGTQVGAYAIGKIPLVGTELSKLFTFGASYAEGVYKENKVNKLKGDPQSSEAVLAKIKLAVFKDSMGEIDKSYKKVRMSIEELNSSSQTLNYCSDFMEAFYKFYRVENRMNKLILKINMVKETLAGLEKELQSQYNLCQNYKDELIDKTNSYTESHFDSEKCLNHSSSKFGHICINDVASLKKLVEEGEKSKLLG